jgi:Sec-independent protein translocase protein TatA
MNILGVGPAELLFILILGLLVIGPERLPDIARSLGRLVARWRLWQQQSPEMLMFQQIRAEFEQEIQQLRDEIDQTQRRFVSNIETVGQEGKTVLNDLSQLAVDPTKHARDQILRKPVATSKPHRKPINPSETNNQVIQQHAQASDGNAPEHHQNGTHPQSLISSSVVTIIPDNDLESDESFRINRNTFEEYVSPSFPDPDYAPMDPRIQSLMEDLHALQEQLRQHGCLDPDWKPPSHMR